MFLQKWTLGKMTLMLLLAAFVFGLWIGCSENPQSPDKLITSQQENSLEGQVINDQQARAIPWKWIRRGLIFLAGVVVEIMDDDYKYNAYDCVVNGRMVKCCDGPGDTCALKSVRGSDGQLYIVKSIRTPTGTLTYVNDVLVKQEATIAITE